ncbi:MAG: hypothetical protein KIT73_02710, partial [Burkholderiales bacterium]|nr:hypothetical protein [Burkholderiales bacterium]
MALSLEEALALIVKLKRRVDHLERVLAANNIHPMDPASTSVATLPTATAPGLPPIEDPPASSSSDWFPPIDLMNDPPPKPPETITARAALEDMPRIMDRIVEYWESGAADPYMTRLIIDDRGDRKGFSMEVMDELLFLARLIRTRTLLAAKAAQARAAAAVTGADAGKSAA